MTEQEALALLPGTQVLYIPMHAEGDPEHGDCEAGFITSVKRQSSGKVMAFCRYWYPDGRMRTTSCSELTPIEYLIEKDTYHQSKVVGWMKEQGVI